MVLALRGAAGALEDLAEEAGPILLRERETSGAEAPVAEKKSADKNHIAGAEEAPELFPIAPKVEQEEQKEPVAEIVDRDEGQGEPDEKKDEAGDAPTGGKEVKKRRRKRDRSSKEEPKGERKRRRRQKEKSVAIPSEAVHQPPASAEHPTGDRPREQTFEEARLGLQPAPKPAASRGIPVSEIFPRLLPPPPPPRRPRSPSHPPPHRESHRGGRQGYWGGKQRARSPTKRPRGSKGAKHRQRGIDRRAGRY